MIFCIVKFGFQSELLFKDHKLLQTTVLVEGVVRGGVEVVTNKEVGD